MAAQTTQSRSAAESIHGNGYIAFSDLPLPVDDKHTAQIITPALATAWADAIVTYWEHGVNNATIRADQPCYLLDLNPGCGQFVWLLLQALRTKIGDRNGKLCYLACSTHSEPLNALLQHPYLQPAIEDHSFDTALISATFDALHLQHQRHVLLRTDNPIVVIGLGYFQTLYYTSYLLII